MRVQTARERESLITARSFPLTGESVATVEGLAEKSVAFAKDAEWSRAAQGDGSIARRQQSDFQTEAITDVCMSRLTATQ